MRQVDGDDVRPPLPVKRDVLYDNSMPHRYIISLSLSLIEKHDACPPLWIIGDHDSLTLLMSGVCLIICVGHNSSWVL